MLWAHGRLLSPGSYIRGENEPLLKNNSFCMLRRGGCPAPTRTGISCSLQPSGGDSRMRMRPRTLRSGATERHTLSNSSTRCSRRYDSCPFSLESRPVRAHSHRVEMGPRSSRWDTPLAPPNASLRICATPTAARSTLSPARPEIQPVPGSLISFKAGCAVQPTRHRLQMQPYVPPLITL